MNYTSNFNLKKPIATENYDVEDQNSNMDIIDGVLAALTKIHTAGGTANAITIDTGGVYAYVQGLPISFRATVDSTGDVTAKVDDKSVLPLVNPDGSRVILKQGQAYQMYYDSSDVFFLWARAEGDVLPDEVLAGKTYSSRYGVGLVGTGNLKKYASGSATAITEYDGSYFREKIVITGLTFKPSTVIAYGNTYRSMPATLIKESGSTKNYFIGLGTFNFPEWEYANTSLIEGGFNITTARSSNSITPQSWSWIAFE